MGVNLVAHTTRGTRYVYPVTYRDVVSALGALPAEHRRLVRAVWLSYHRCGGFGKAGDGLVNLNCGMWPSRDHLLRPRADCGIPDCAYGFGGRAGLVGGRIYEVWRKDDYRRYILAHVLPHEVGHLIANAGGHHLDTARAEEAFCEQYAWEMCQGILAALR